jgi:hypothetical protein
LAEAGIKRAICFGKIGSTLALQRKTKDKASMKKMINPGVIYLLIAVLFAIGAIGKTISADPGVLVLQWICAGVFTLTGIMQFRKNANRK